LLLAIWNLAMVVPSIVAPEGAVGIDYVFFRDAAHRWLTDGGFYLPHQLAGPYPIVAGVEVLYPPVALWLFVPLVWLPAVVWWAVPIAILFYAFWRIRPEPWTWPYLAIVLWYPRTAAMFVYGSTSLWVLALVALAIVHPWAGPLSLFKPSFLPFAVVGAHKRAWWVALAIVVLACLPFGAMWGDYAAAMANATNSSLLYSFFDFPILLAPMIAATKAGWFDRTRERFRVPVRASTRARRWAAGAAASFAAWMAP